MELHTVGTQESPALSLLLSRMQIRLLWRRPRRTSFLGRCPELCHWGRIISTDASSRTAAKADCWKKGGLPGHVSDRLASPHAPQYLQTHLELLRGPSSDLPNRLSCAKRLGKRILTSPKAAAWCAFSKSAQWQGNLFSKHYMMSYKTYYTEQTQADGCPRVLNDLQLIMQTLTLTN